MAPKKSLAKLLREILKQDPRAAIVLGEILGPPPGLKKGPPQPFSKGADTSPFDSCLV